MNRIFRQFFLIALLSVCGVNNGFAVTATPRKQGLGDMDFTHFSYLDLNGHATTASNFGSWSSTPTSIGCFEERRQVVMHLCIPEAGTYAVRYEFGHPSETEFSLATSNGTVRSYGSDNATWIAPITGDYTNFYTNFLILNINEPKDSMAVYIKNVTGGTTGTDMRTFRLGYLHKAQAARQTVGKLSIQKFGYCDTVPDFGLWCDYHTTFSNSDNQINNFTKDRSDTIKLHLPSEGLYCIAFQYARRSDNPTTATYTVSGSNSQCTINTSSLTFERTGNDSTFSKKNYIYLTATEECNVDVAIKNTSSGDYAYARMKDFELIKADVAEPTYQGVGELDFKKFAYNAFDENFGYWFEKDYIGNFTDGRADTLKLDLPAAGHYRVSFKIATTQDPQYILSSGSDIVKNILVDVVQHSRNDIIYCSSTGGVENFTTERYFEFDASAAGNVDIVMRHASEYTSGRSANMKDFKLVKCVLFKPAYQGIGKLAIDSFAYAGTNVPFINFGYWATNSITDANYIGNFDGNSRSVTLKLRINEAGIYRILFKTARNADGSYKITTNTTGCSVTADNRTDAYFNFSSTQGDLNFTQIHYIDLVANITEASDVDIKMEVNNNWANMKDFELIKCLTAAPSYQGLGKLAIDSFAYAGNNTPRENFGFWDTDSITDENYIGQFDGNSRSVTLKLRINEAGNYRILFKTARNADGSYKITTNTTGCSVTADNRTDAYFNFSSTQGDLNFTQTHYIDLVANITEATDVDIKMEVNNNWANMKDFELIKCLTAAPSYQGLGKLAIDSFAYAGNNTPRENFGFWVTDKITEDNYIGNFTNGRIDTIKLHFNEAGDYKISFKSARNGSNNYAVSGINCTTSPSSITCGTTGNDTLFTTENSIYVTVSDACDAAVVINNNDNGYANMKAFVITKKHPLQPEYQSVGDLQINKFSFVGNGVPLENFGYWYNKGYIGNFSNNRTCTLHLNLLHPNTKYKVTFKSARKDSGNGTYTVNAAFQSSSSAIRRAPAEDASDLSWTVDGYIKGGLTCGQTNGDEDFAQDHTIELFTSTDVGPVNLTITNTALYANMDEFVFSEVGRKIELNANGGTCPQSYMYSQGDVIGGLPVALRDGYVLKGWSKDKDGVYMITASTPVEGIDTLYAKWEEADPKYKPVAHGDGFVWNQNYTMTSGLHKEVKGIWVSGDASNGQLCESYARTILAGQTIVIKFPLAYYGADSKYYDIYSAITLNNTISSSAQKWTANVKSGNGWYITIYPESKIDNYSYNLEFWLQEGDRNAIDVEFIAGGCYIDGKEYAIVYGDKNIVNAKLEESKYTYSSSVPDISQPGWQGNNSDANDPNSFLVGTGYTADHHVKMVYKTIGGNGNSPEFTIGYLNCKYTFQTLSGTVETPYTLNSMVQLSQHEDTAVNMRQGWEIIEGKLVLQNGDTLKAGDWLNVVTRDQIKVIGNVTLKAHAPFDVTFDKVLEKATVFPASKQVEKGGYYGELPVPTCSGYSFDGWYFANNITLVTDADIVDTLSTHTLYAHWHPNAPMERTTWNPNGITLSIDPANDPIEDDNVSVTIGDSTFQSPITRVGCNLYKVELPFENNAFADSTLYIQVDDGGYTYQTRIPYMVGKGGELKSNMSLVVPDTQNWKDTSAITLDTVEIYEQATVTLKAEVTVSSLVIRANATANKYPQIIEDGGQFKATKDTFWFDYELDANVMYTFATTGNVAAATLFNLNLRNNDFILDTAYYVDYYDGTQRASTGAGWKNYDGTTLMTPMQGYTIAAEPDVCDLGSTNPIVRMPMAYPSGEKTVLVQEYSSSIAKKEAGWNLLGNPYLCTWYGGHSVADDKGKFRYMTIPTHTGSYSQEKAEEVALEPFHNFFVQSDRTVKFTFSADKLSSAPARAAQVDKQEQSIGIRLSNGIAGDKTEMLLGDAFDDTYEVNADLLKMNGNADAVVLYTLLGNTRLAYHATSNTLAAHAIAVGYSVKDKSSLTFSALDMPDNANYQALILTDTEANKEVNLLQSDYTFTPTALSSNQRFTLRCVPRTIPTNVDADILADYIPEDAIVTVYNTLGGVMKVAPSTLNTLPNGVYIIQVQSGSSARVWKYSVNK